jgi:hypothetical protein
MLPNADSRREPAAITIPMFSGVIHVLWFLLLACTLFSELVPLSQAFEAQFSTLIFHCYEAAKLLAFFLFGFLTPLAWWQYRSLGTGVIFAIVTTAIVEIGQAFIPGHRPSMFELSTKLVLLFVGFAIALDLRKYQTIHVGPICVRFSSRYW